MQRLVLVAGARPNFMKIAPLCRALGAQGVMFTLVHTGQHYDPGMSEVFFRELEIPTPHLHLGIGSGDRLYQTRKILDALIPFLLEHRSNGVIVVGDVMSTAAGAMAGFMAGIPVCHVEAGLRSFNWRMPEELNRMIADHHSHWLFVSEPSGMENLRHEAIPETRVYLVGNIMIDTLRRIEPRADQSSILLQLGLGLRQYGVVTLHRPENVDHQDAFQPLWHALGEVASELPLVFPMHPRTRERLMNFGWEIPSGIRLLDPIGYVDMLALTKGSRLVITDSGGMQEETTVLGIPCLTLREQTERPVTVTVGTSEVVGKNPAAIHCAVERVLSNRWKHGAIPDLWDGHTAERIVGILSRL